MKKIFVLMLLCLSAATACFSQGAINAFAETGNPSTHPQLFRLNPEQYNHHFEIILPNEGLLKIDFLRLSDWGEKNQLESITAAAAKQARLLKDSFTNSYSTKLLEMNIPVNEKIISLNYQEDNSGKRQLAYKEGSYYQLKTSFDTIRVIRNIGIRTKPHADSGLIQVQYTFILKDINDIVTLAADPQAINHIGTLVDEAISKKRNRWSNQDALIHTLSLKYNPASAQPVNTGNFDFSFSKYINIYLGIGAAVFTDENGNSISPYLEESLVYLIPSRNKMQPFIGLNLNAFGFASTDGSKAGYVSYNFEYGFCKRSTGLVQQKTSIMLGLMRKYENNNSKNMFHMGFTFGFNSYLSGGFNVATDFKKDSKDAIMGVNFKFNL